jgi:hypothetical protein
MGCAQEEFWANERPAKRGEAAKPSEVMLRPDQLMLREAIKRGLRFTGQYSRFMQIEYVHPRTLDDFEPREIERRVEEFKDDEYEIDDVVASVRALRVEDGGDPLLDLGKPDPQTTKILKREEVSQAERGYRAEQAATIARIYAESQAERDAMGLP